MMTYFCDGAFNAASKFRKIQLTACGLNASIRYACRSRLKWKIDVRLLYFTV